MSRPTPPDEQGVPRVAVLAALLRASVNVTLMVAVYYVAPLDGFRLLGGALLVGGLLLLGGLIAWQVRRIAASGYPGLRAVEAVSVIVPAFLVLFAAAYVAMSRADPAAFTGLVTRTDALYFVVTVFATVGFGDIAPVSQAARVVVTLQIVGDLIMLGAVLRAVLDAVRVGRRRRADGAGPPP